MLITAKSEDAITNRPGIFVILSLEVVVRGGFLYATIIRSSSLKQGLL